MKFRDFSVSRKIIPLTILLVSVLVALSYLLFFNTKKESEAFTVTAQGVYYRGGLLKKIDPFTFKILWLQDTLEYRAIVKDKNAVYSLDFVSMFNVEGAAGNKSPWAVVQRANFALIRDCKIVCVNGIVDE